MRKKIVLIDDDVLVRMTWRVAASTGLVDFSDFPSAQEFLNKISDFDLETKIYLDSNLGEVSGQEVACLLYYLYGFKQLYLATGYPKTHFVGIPWVHEVIRDIVGKEPPF